MKAHRPRGGSRRRLAAFDLLAAAAFITIGFAPAVQTGGFDGDPAPSFTGPHPSSERRNTAGGGPRASPTFHVAVYAVLVGGDELDGWYIWVLVDDQWGEPRHLPPRRVGGSRPG